MEIDISELVVRYLQQPRNDSARDRVLRTAALFLRPDDEAVVELLKRESRIDSELVGEIAAVASPIEIAVMLGRLGSRLPPNCFSALLNEVHETTTDTRALRESGDAAAHYERLHPGSITVPPELAERLLDSPDEYARLVGLKLLRRFYQDPSMFFKSALAALENGTNSERCGAAHELICACDDPAHRFLAALGDDSIATLRQSLEAASQHHDDGCTRDNAAIALGLLGHFEADRANAPKGSAHANMPQPQSGSPVGGTHRPGMVD